MVLAKKSQLLTLCLCFTGPFVPLPVSIPPHAPVKVGYWKWHITDAFPAKEALFRKSQWLSIGSVEKFSVCVAGLCYTWLVVFLGCWTKCVLFLQSCRLIIIYSHTEQGSSLCLLHWTALHLSICLGDEIKGRNGNACQAEIFRF